MKLRLSCGFFAFCLAAAYAQTVSFEVASVKPAERLIPQRILTGEQHIGRRLDKARVEYSSVTLSNLIGEAYDLKAYQLSGPDFLNGPRFNIQAKMPDGASEAQIPQMLQALLSERFGLKFHKETRERTVYDVVTAKGGSKMKPSDAVPGSAEDASQGMQLSGNMQSGKGLTVTNNPLGGGTMQVNMNADGSMRLDMATLSMARFAELLSRMLDRPVVDATGLKGAYQVSLELPMSAVMAMAGLGGIGGPRMNADSPDNSAVVFGSVEKLGLKLEQRKGQVDTMIIDHLEKTPTEN